jgi:hypothetical protein
MESAIPEFRSRAVTAIEVWSARPFMYQFS